MPCVGAGLNKTGSAPLMAALIRPTIIKWFQISAHDYNKARASSPIRARSRHLASSRMGLPWGGMSMHDASERSPQRHGRPLHAGAAMMRPRPAATRARRRRHDHAAVPPAPLAPGRRARGRQVEQSRSLHTPRPPDSASFSSPRLRDCVSYAWRTETRRKPRTHRSNRVQVAAAFAWHAP
jgi:hypothetical protein